MEVRLLGPIEFVATSGERAALTGAKVRGVLAMLALEAGHPVAPGRLLGALWADADGASANALQVAIAKLRRALADVGERDRLVTRPAGYLLDVEPEFVDALRFESRLQEPAGAGPALALWRGVALADAPETDVVRAVRTRLDELRQAAEEADVEAALAGGNYSAAAARLAELVAAEPLRERRWVLLMQAHYAAGQQADALRTYARARELLVREIGVEPGPELRRLEAAVLAQDDVGVLGPASSPEPVGSGFRRSGNLRHPVGTLVGRDRELRSLVEAVATHRLVTLTGPGGVGKTRLALAVAGELEPEQPDGVWLVEFAAARDARDVVVALGRALGLDDAGSGELAAGLAAVTSVLADGDAVLVFDNCEHVIDAVAHVVVEVLERCRRVRVVTTSRESLDVAGEFAYPVEPLSAEAAVALFDARTAGLGLPDADAAVVAGICERLDRLPLGIELAAARSRHLRLPELLDRLGTPLALLDDGTRIGAPERRGLRAVADWSYQLLDGPERDAFESLSVFSDGATLGGAVAVCAARGIPPGEVERVLHRLVDKSLLWVDRSGATTRYRMLQTLHDYSSEQLVERGAAEAAHRAHAEWVADLVATVAFGERTTGGTVAAVLDEDAAIRDALAWSASAEPRLGLEVASALVTFWFGTMRVSTGWDLIAGALEAAAQIEPGSRVVAVAWASLFAAMLFDDDAASRYEDEVAAVEDRVHDPVSRGSIALTRALAAGYANDPRGHEAAERARQEFARAEHAIGLGYVDFAEGALHVVEGSPDAAATSLGAAITAFRRHGDHLGLVLALSRLGELAWRVGDVDLFIAMHAEMLELGRSGRTPGVVAGATARLAMGHLARGDLVEAERLARDALASSGGSFMPVVNGFAFRSAALVDLALGHVAAGRRGLEAAINAFSRGAGQVGAGYAVLCRIDLSRSLVDAGDLVAARELAEAVGDAAAAVGDPWVCEQAEALRAEVRATR